jgi:RNA polymerase sigma factor (sigma-70 family)
MNCLELCGSSKAGRSDESTREAVEAASSRWDEALSVAEQRDAIADAILALPDTEKLVIGLYYYENLTADGITKVMKISSGDIAKSQARALMRLRGKLGRTPFDEDD